MRPGTRSILSCVVFGVWFLSAQSAAHAEDARETSARKAFQRGEQLYKDQKYAEAAAAFEEGYRLKPSPAFLFDLAMTYRALGASAETIRYFQAYLKAQPDAGDRSAVEEAIKEELHKLKKAAAEPPIAPPQASPPPPKMNDSVASKIGANAPLEFEKEAGPPPAKTESPAIYRKWWLWTATGVVAASAVAIGLGVGLSQTGTDPYREVTWR